jgi:hypothetical protein
MMKHYLTNKISRMLKIFGLVALLGTAGSVSAQLNGTSYTINSGAATSCVGASSTGTNFTNWSDFVTYFNTYGISNTSKVTVVTDQVTTVTTSLTLTQYASAPTSSTKRLIIDGNSKKLSSSATYEVLGLNGIDYLTIKDLIVENSNTGSSQSCIRIYGGADYCSEPPSPVPHHYCHHGHGDAHPAQYSVGTGSDVLRDVSSSLTAV